jgi:prepilin-type N-terminal cleavage/methylation domain-containing protein
MAEIVTKFNRKKSSSQGFTLLEMLVAILIFSMVTMIMAFALKLCIGAWERGRAEGDSFQLKVSVPALIQKQLGSLVGERVFVQGGKQEKLAFMGKESAVSFFTTHTPGMLTGRGGLYRVTYIYDEDAGQLDIYQQLITSSSDLSAELNPFSDDWDGERKPDGTVHGIDAFSMAYASGAVIEPGEKKAWTSEWKKTAPKPPAGVKLLLQSDTERKVGTGVWYLGIRSGR